MRVAVIGAGPVGLEAALRLRADGHDAVVYEGGAVGDAVRRWGHVTLFTPWHMNTTSAGRAAVGAPGLDGEHCPTGAELVERYLEPLAAGLDVRLHHRVRGLARVGLRKGDLVPPRAAAGFVVHVEGPDGDRLDRADAVLDCTGTFGQPVPAGLGGLEVPGEAALVASGRLRHGPVRVRDPGGHVVLVGDGASAATVLLDLLAHGARVTWLGTTSEGPRFASPDGDPLPGRRALWQGARDALRHPAVRHVVGRAIVAFEPGDPIGVRLDDGERVAADAVVACAGFRPDLALHRELQVHSCYASEGPMKLAAALLTRQDTSADCLAPAAHGPDLLRNPEPRFFVLGAKSYGRRGDFLLQVGHRQVDEVLTLLRPEP